MALEGFLKRLGMWTTVLRWNEPMLYRVRLRGDLGWRLLAAFGVGGAATCLLLVLFAINVKPPHFAYAFFGMLVLGGLAFLLLAFGKANASGSVRVCQEGIIRQRHFVAFTSQWIDEASWSYPAIEQCVIVPGQAIGESFSLLFVSSGGELDVIGVPRRTDLGQLAQFLSTKGLVVQQGSYVPQSFTRRMSLPLALASAAVGCFLLMGGLGFYLIKVGLQGRGDLPVAERRDFDIDPIAPPRFEGMPPPFARAEATLPGQSAPPPQRTPATAPERGEGFPSGMRGPAGIPFPAGLPRPGGMAPSGMPSDFRGNGQPAGQPGQRVRPSQSSEAAGTRTEVAGGEGGFPFQNLGDGVRPIRGFRYALGSFAGVQALSQLEPLYDSAPAPGQTIVARDGYVVTGLEVDAEKFVTAARVVFARQIADGQLDASDTYKSDWIGTPTDKPTQVLGGGTSPLTGIYGRRGALIDALGAVVAESSRR